MLNKMTKMALVGALMLGTASAVQAANENDGGNETGGYALPGSTAGVNPAYHQGRFGQTHNNRAGDAFGYAPWNSSDGGRGAFGYQPAERGARPRTSFERNWFDYQNQE
jgi:hypothetical protein